MRLRQRPQEPISYHNATAADARAAAAAVHAYSGKLSTTHRLELRLEVPTLARKGGGLAFLLERNLGLFLHPPPHSHDLRLERRALALRRGGGGGRGRYVGHKKNTQE